MRRTEVLKAALSMPPEKIGVARLCQELLSDITGKPITKLPERDPKCATASGQAVPPVRTFSPVHRKPSRDAFCGGAGRTEPFENSAATFSSPFHSTEVP